MPGDDKRILELPTTGIAGSTDAIPIVQGGVNKRIAALDLHSSFISIANDWQNGVLMILSDPSVLTPSDGDRYLIGKNAIGDWNVQDDKIAEWNDYASVWLIFTPRDGSIISVGNRKDVLFKYEGTHPTGRWIVDLIVTNNLSLLKMYQDFISSRGSLNIDILRYENKIAEDTLVVNISDVRDRIAIEELFDGYVAGYADNGDGNKGKFQIYDSDMNAVGGEVTFETNIISNVVITRSYNDNQICILYIDDIDDELEFVRYDSVGNKITGSERVLRTNTLVDVTMEVLSNGNFVIGARDDGDGGKGKLIIIDKHGDNVSYEDDFSAAQITELDISSFLNDNFVVIYKLSGGEMKYRTYDKDGNILKVETTFATDATTVSSTHSYYGVVGVSYKDVNDSNKGKINTIDSEGNLGSAVTFDTNIIGSNSLVPLPNGDFMLSWSSFESGGLSYYMIFDSKLNVKQSKLLFFVPDVGIVKSAVLSNGDVTFVYIKSGVAYQQILEGIPVFNRQPYFNDGNFIRPMAGQFVVSFTVTRDDIATAAKTNDIELFNLPAGYKFIHTDSDKPSVGFGGGGETEVKASIGISGNLTYFAGQINVFTGSTEGFNESAGGYRDYDLSTSIRFAIESTTNNLSSLTVGSMTITGTIIKII